MCGFELIELQKRVGISAKGGRPKKLPNNLEVLSWPELVKQKIGKSDETSRNWMNMARAVAPRLKKLGGSWNASALLALPPSEWSEEARVQVEKTLKGVCEGQTQVDFMRELGLVKKPPGNGGGDNSGSVEEAKPIAPEQLAQDLFHPLALSLFKCASEGQRLKLLLLPITSDKPGDITGLSDLRDHLSAFLSLVEVALDDKKKAARKGDK